MGRALPALKRNGGEHPHAKDGEPRIVVNPLPVLIDLPDEHYEK